MNPATDRQSKKAKDWQKKASKSKKSAKVTKKLLKSL